MIDLTFTTCDVCKKGILKETTLFDDMDGVLHCTSCNITVDRYKCIQNNIDKK